MVRYLRWMRILWLVLVSVFCLTESSLALFPSLTSIEALDSEILRQYSAVSFSVESPLHATQLTRALRETGYPIDPCDADLDVVTFSQYEPIFCIFAHESQIKVLNRILDSPVEILNDDLSQVFGKIEEKDIASAAEITSGVPEDVTNLTSEEYYGQFRTLEEMYSRMYSIAEKHSIATVETIGETNQNRSILALRIGKTGDGDSPPIRIVIQAMLHAREWVAGTSALYVAEKVAALFSGEETRNDDDFDFEKFGKNVQLVIVPVNNPDGYVHSRQKNRLWRKNRNDLSQDSEGPVCLGVDLNRNFGTDWDGGQASSADVCSSLFRGFSSFSEPETAAIQKLLLEESTQGLIAHLDFHSYGQFVLSPFGYTTNSPPRAERIEAFVDSIARAMSSRYNNEYIAGSIARTLYLASGVSVDWVHSQLGALSAGIELRPSGYSGSFGFQLASEEIIATGEEALAGVLGMFKFLIGEEDSELYALFPPVPTANPAATTPENLQRTPGCFAASSLVNIRDKHGTIREVELSQVTEGQEIETWSETQHHERIFSELYSMQHSSNMKPKFAPVLTIEFVELYTRSKRRRLSATFDHLLVVQEDLNAIQSENIQYKTMNELRIGDYLILYDGQYARIESIEYGGVQRILNPLTLTHNVVINGIRASSHPSTLDRLLLNKFISISRTQSIAIMNLAMLHLRLSHSITATTLYTTLSSTFHQIINSSLIQHNIALLVTRFSES